MIEYICVYIRSFFGNRCLQGYKRHVTLYHQLVILHPSFFIFDIISRLGQEKMGFPHIRFYANI